MKHNSANWTRNLNSSQKMTAWRQSPSSLNSFCRSSPWFLALDRDVANFHLVALSHLLCLIKDSHFLLCWPYNLQIKSTGHLIRMLKNLWTIYIILYSERHSSSSPFFFPTILEYSFSFYFSMEIKIIEIACLFLF
jgi:hypothetical protein